MRKLTDATIDPTSCFIEGKCLAHDAPIPRLPCFKCDATNHQKAVPPLPDLTNHCYFTHGSTTLCRKRGESAPAYARYGSNSVCETCDPDRDPNAWSLTTGFFHDRDTASERSAGANDYGMYFASRSSGCQILPDMPTPSAVSDALAVDFETSLHYGHSVARVKVQQALA